MEQAEFRTLAYRVVPTVIVGADEGVDVETGTAVVEVVDVGDDD